MPSDRAPGLQARDDGTDVVDSEPTRDDRKPNRSRLGLAAFTVAVLSLAVRASVLRDAYFITDDYMLSSRAIENDLTFDYLTRVHTGHFEPIGFGVMWVLAHFAPYSWVWASVFMLGCQVILLILLWQLLVELFGHRLLILVPFTLFAFSPLTIAAFTWLAAGIIWFPLMISMAGMLRFHTRFVRDGGQRNVLIALMWFCVGLAAFEKILIFLPFLLVFTFALEFSFGRNPWRIRSLLKRQWSLWLGYGVLTVLYLMLYVRGSRSAGATTGLEMPTAADLGDFVWQTLGRTFVPGIVGGPWAWAPQSYGLAVVDSPRFFDWIAWAVCVAFVVASITIRRHATVYWASIAVYLAASMAIIAVGRVPYLGSVFALETRYLADAVLPMVVILGICLMPLKGEEQILTRDGRRWSDALRSVGTPIALASTAVVSVLSLHAISSYSAFSSNNPTRAFVANARAGLEELPGDAQIVDTWLPENVNSPFFGDYNRASRFLAPLVAAEQRDDLYTRDSYSRPYVLANDGSLIPMIIEPLAFADPPSGVCRPQRAGKVTVPLTNSLHSWDWVLRIGYLSEADFDATVTFGSRSTTVPIAQGVGGIYVSLQGDGKSISLSGIPPLTNFCVGDIQVGTAKTTQ